MIHRLVILIMTGLLVLPVAAKADDRARAAYPNEPEGYVPWFRHDWQSFPTGEGERLRASGAGLIRGGRAPENFELVDDPGAPHGKGMSLRHRQRRGQMSGNTSGTFELFHPKPAAGESLRQDDQVKLRSVYRSHWALFEPHPETGDWQFGSTHMRTFWWNRFYGLGWANVSLASPAHPATLSHRHDHFRGASFWFYPSDPATGGTSSIRLAEPDARYELGVWYHLEYLWETQGNFGDGDAGMNDSRIRIWIDGDLKSDQVVTHYIRAPFAMDHFAMVWLGGRTDGQLHPREQDEYLRFGDIYISGVVHEESSDRR